MSTQTERLGLFKYDPVADKEELFDIQTSLNDNWDKIDEAIGSFSQSDWNQNDESAHDYIKNKPDISTLMNDKMDKNNPVGTGSFSMNRKSGSVIGNNSHAEGYDGIASGQYSHAEGYSTEASHKSQHVQGENNIVDDSTAASTERGNYAHIVGNGTYDVRSNAHTLDWNGNAWFAGNVYVGSTSGKNKDDGSKVLVTQEYIDIRVPAWTSADEGKFLCIVNGTPTWTTVTATDDGAGNVTISI